VYPAGWQPVVQATPLYQATALCRELMLGAVGAATVGHVAYLVVMGLAGLAVAARRIDQALLR
jgi:lipooligosaccharide transport system permease protein